jgi:hypothetical protein
MTASVMGQDLFAGTFRNGIPDLGRSQRNHHLTISGFPLLATSARSGAPRQTAGLRPNLENDLLERLYRGSFVVLYVEDGIKLGDLEQIVDLLGEVQQLQFAALIFGRGESAYEFADA